MKIAYSEGCCGGGRHDKMAAIGRGGVVDIFVRIEFTPSPIGNSFYPPTHLGLPVKSNFSFILFPQAAHGAQCSGNAVFQSLN